MKLYFSNDDISKVAVETLVEAGLQITWEHGENVLFIPEEEWKQDEWLSSNKSVFSVRNVKITKKQVVFQGSVDAPKVYSTLHDDMVPSGVDRFQCSVCGRWMDSKMTASDEKSHDYYCRPQYRWEVAS